MSEPVFIGHNELGIRVYEIEEGGMRPLVVDHQGNMECRFCRVKAQPLRITLQPVRSRSEEWALLCCPSCPPHFPHCLMKVKLLGRESVAMVPGIAVVEGGKSDA